MLRSAVILGLTALLVGGAQALPANGAPALPPPVPRPSLPSADAYVTSAAPRKNFGGKKVLRVQGKPATRTYIRFKPFGIPITKALLNLFPRASASGLTIRAAGSKWSERGITFANAPRLSGPAVRVGRIRAGRAVTVDVTRLVAGKFTVSLVLTGPAGAFASREAAASFKPTLRTSVKWPTLGAAGDIGDCNSPWDSATATQLDRGGTTDRVGTVAALGDLAYENGSLAEFNACYQPSWGPLKSITKPAPGNHEYQTPGAAGYFAYWGAVAGNPNQGWYSYDIRRWHIVSLNSNCMFIGGCEASSPQETWLRADLAAHKTKCTLAYWHHPLFSGSLGTAETDMAPLWQALYDNNADVVLSAHAHNYQRFAPQTSAGVADPARGIREFVVGTGGNHNLHSVTAIANTEVMQSTTWGVLILTLRDTGYDWYFSPVLGGSFTDSGSQACH